MTENGIFDRLAVRRHRDRAAKRLDAVRPLLDDLTARLLDRLDDTTAKFTTALDLGGRGAVAPALRARGMAVVAADVSAAMLSGSGGVAMDPEALPFGEKSFDLIIAAFSLHFTDDLPGALIQLRRALKPGGMFLAAMPALGTLADLRAALLAAEEELTGAVSPRISPFPDLRDCAGLLQRAGFELPVADVEDIEFLYANRFLLLHDLRAAGETNAVLARRRRTPPRDLFPAALAKLPQREGRMIATLRMAIMTGWAPS